MKKQTTIKKRVSIDGNGLHGGKPVTVTFSPLKANSGIVFINNGESYRLGVKKVFSTKRGTSVKKGRSTVHTVEHLVSAVRGMGIDNLRVEIKGNETPVLDGSARLYVRALKKAGIIRLAANKKIFRPEKPEVISEKGCYMAVIPYEGFKVHYFSDFSKYKVPPENFSLAVSPAAYEKHVAGARTFGFKSELKWLAASGLIKGASLENAVLIDNGKPVKTKLRYKNELTRHKVLDVIGDFGFIEGGLNMVVIAVKTGHKHNIKMVRQILTKSKK